MYCAFDIVKSFIVLEILSQTGIFSAHVCPPSYLADGSNAICSNSTVSDKFPFISGVPQWSVLGSLLFNVYFSFLCLLFKQLIDFFHVYDDDNKISSPRFSTLGSFF